MDVEKMKRLKSKARVLEPVVRVGKNGLTENILQQINKILKKRELIKVKFLKCFVETHDRKSAAMEIAEKTGAKIVEQVGFVVVLCKEQRNVYKSGVAIYDMKKR